MSTLPDPWLPYAPRLALTLAASPQPCSEIEGSLLFVDVSGFTALSERLAAFGREGAEEITDLIDAIFSRMLAVVRDQSGALLSFGGDALLLFFDGPEHAARAARAAGLIRKVPGQLGRYRTSAGMVRLKVSMGLHSGVFAFVVAGTEHRLLIVGGPDVGRTLALEKRAEAGEIALSAQIATALGPACVATAADGQLMLNRVPRQTPSPELPPVHGSAVHFLAEDLREHVRLSPGSDHRRVAIAFVRFNGLDRLLQDEGVAGAAAHLDALVGACQSACHEHGVTLLANDVDADGGKLLLTAGAPRASDRAAERLLQATRAVVAHVSPLTLRAGVASGAVFAGDVGASFRRCYSVIGDQVNLAARLMAAAEPGHVLASPTVLEESRTRFQTRVLPPMHLKGKKDEISPVVVGPAMDRQNGDAVVSPLIGRDREVQLLEQAIAAAGAGKGSCLEVVGEAGVGKSRLMAELVELATDVPHHRFVAEPYEQSTPYAFARRLLRDGLGLTLDAPAEQVRQALTQKFPDSAAELALAAHADDVRTEQRSDEHQGERIARAAAQALQQLHAPSTVLLLEDLHWADEQSLLVVRRLTEAAPGSSLCVVITRRPSGQPVAGSATLVCLEPLGMDSAAELAAVIGSELAYTARQLQAVLDRAGGNPLFLTQLLQSSLAPGGELPATVEEVLAARIDSLDPQTRGVLRDASVLGTEFSREVLGQLLPEVDVGDSALWRRLRGFVERRGGHVAFQHALLRDVAYAGLPRSRRRMLHERAGAALEGTDEVELLALHFRQAVDHPRTWTYGREAGDRARRRGGHDEAADHYQSALLAHERGRLGPAHERRVVLTSLAEALDHAGRQEDALAAFRRARALTARGSWGDPWLLLREGQVRVGLGRYAQAHTWYRRGLAAMRPDDDPETAIELRVARAGVLFRQGRYDEAVQACDEALDVARATGHRRGLAHADYFAHLVLTTMRSPRRVEHRTIALATYEELDDLAGQARVLNNLGIDAYYEGSWDEAAALYARSTRCETQDGNAIGAAISDNNLAEILSDQGRYDEAQRHLDAALRAFRAARYPIGEMIVRSNLGRLATRRDDFGRAQEQLELALAGFREIGAQGMEPDVMVRLLELYLGAGRLAEAQELLSSLPGRPDDSDELGLTVLRLKGALLQLLGDTEGALTVWREALRVADETAQYARALLHQSIAEARSAGGADGRADETAAQALFDQLGVLRTWHPARAVATLELSSA